jgi:hypothetical protein
MSNTPPRSTSSQPLPPAPDKTTGQLRIDSGHLSDDSQDVGSPPLLSLPNDNADDTGFFPVSVVHRLRTTPLHAATPQIIDPTPTLIGNTFGLLATNDLPPATPLLTRLAVVTASQIHQHQSTPTPAAQTASSPRTLWFLTTFQENWPEDFLPDDSPQQIWNTLRLGCIAVDNTYDTLKGLQDPFHVAHDHSWHACLEQMDVASTQFDSNMALFTKKLANQQEQMKTILSCLTTQNDTLIQQGSTLEALQTQGLAHARRFDNVNVQL